MPRLLITVLALLVVTVAGGIGYLASRDPNRFKPEIEALIRDQTGLEARLGDLGWRLWPPLAIEASAVSATYPGAPRLIEAKRLAFDLGILPLLSTEPRLEIRGMRLEGVALTLQRDVHGVANWQAPKPTRQPAPATVARPHTSAPSDATWLVPLLVGPLHIDGRIELADAAAQRALRLDEFMLETSAARPGEAIPLTLAFLASAAAGPRARIEASTGLILPESASGEVIFTELKVTGEAQLAADRPGEPLTLRVPKAHYDLAHGRLDVPDARGTLAGTSASAALNLGADPLEISGNLAIQSPDPARLAQAFADLGTTRLPDSAALTVTFSYAPPHLELTDIALSADNELLTGSATVALGETPNLRFRLRGQALNLDPYLAGSDEPVGAAAPAAAAGLLPASTLQSVAWHGEIDLGRLLIGGYALENAHITTEMAAGALNNTLQAELLGGQVSTGLIAELQEPPDWRLDLTMRGIDGKALVDRLAPGWHFEGKLALDAKLHATGNDPDVIAASLRGPIRIDGGQGRLDIRGLKAQAATLGALAGRSAAVANWPDVLDYSRLTGALDLDGLDALTFNGALDNLVIDGRGGYDLAGNRVELQATLTVNDDPRYHSFDVNEYLVGVPIPIRCAGPLGGDARLCKLDADRAQDVIARALRGAGGDKVRERLERTIDEKVPEQFRDAAKGFLDLLGRSPREED